MLELADFRASQKYRFSHQHRNIPSELYISLALTPSKFAIRWRIIAAAFSSNFHQVRRVCHGSLRLSKNSKLFSPLKFSPILTYSWDSQWNDQRQKVFPMHRQTWGVRQGQQIAVQAHSEIVSFYLFHFSLSVCNIAFHACTCKL